MYKKGNLVLGLIFVIIGVLFLLSNLNLPGFEFDIFDIGFFFANFWPLFIIIPGLIFHYAFFAGRNRDAGLLVPGGILLVTGLTCQLSELFNIWHITWPGFILAVAVGLFELYLFGSRERGLLIPVGILGGLSIIFFVSFSVKEILGFGASKILVPAVLIIIGISVLSKGNRKSS